MHLLFLIGRIYPFVAISIAFVAGQMALFYFRRRNRMHIVYSVIAGIFGLTAILWGLYRGDLNSDRWVRALLAAF